MPKTLPTQEMPLQEVDRASLGLEARLAKLASQIERIEKKGENPHHHYKYVRAVDLLDHVRSKAVDLGLLLRPTVIDFQKDGNITTVTIDFTWIDVETGQTATTRWCGSGLDTQEKGLYKAYTGCLKYFLLCTFMIPTGDDPEADEGVRGRGTATATAGHKDVPATAATRKPTKAKEDPRLTAARKRFFGLLDKAVNLGIYDVSVAENTPAGAEARRELRRHLLKVAKLPEVMNLEDWKVVNGSLEASIGLATDAIDEG